MKNILVPIDFSDASFNAVSYAAFLANAFNSRLTLVHAFTDSSAFKSSETSFKSKKEGEEANQKNLQQQIDGIARKFTVKIDGIVKKGKPETVINEIVGKTKASLIVMGMKGKGESNSRFGSTTTRMISKTTVPLMVVPKKASYKTIENITLASDFLDETLLSNFELLEEFIKKFDPFIEILNVQKKKSKLTAELIAGKMSTDLKWDRYNHTFNIIENDDVEEGISRFLKQHPSEVLAMVARKRNVINKIFEPSHTKKMTSQTKIPLLVLHPESV